MSKLKATKPVFAEQRLKALFYGMPGAGKTTAALQFPKPYVFDTEKGSQADPKYIDLINKSGGVSLLTSDFDEVVEQVHALLTEQHDYKTVVIDPFTIIYDDLVDKAGKKHGTDFGRHYNEANKSVKHLLNLLLRLDMNVIITAHAKKEYGENMTVIGNTFDCYKKLDYTFDLVFEVQLRGKGKNIEHVGIVRKSRIDKFPMHDSFPFSYAEIATRYGREILEKDAVPEVLASADQIEEILHLIDLFKVPQEAVDKWLEKVNASSFAECKNSDLQKKIEELKAKITKKSA